MDGPADTQTNVSPPGKTGTQGKEACQRSAIYPGIRVCQGPGVIYTYLPGRLCYASDARIRP
jgi:hypothetical protein